MRSTPVRLADAVPFSWVDGPGNRFVLFLLAFCAGALSTAILPQFSALVARSDWAGLREVLRSCLRWIVTATVPLTLILIALSLPLTRLMFERGAFTPETTAMVAGVQVLYLIQVPFYLISIVLVRLISAFKSNHLLAWGDSMHTAFEAVPPGMFSAVSAATTHATAIAVSPE